MTDTTTRTRHVVLAFDLGNSAIGVAICILRAAGIDTMMDLSAAIGGGQFDDVDAETLAAYNGKNPSGIETAYAYPDRAYRLSDGTVLIADRAEAEEFGIVVGGLYTDEVIVQPFTPEEGATAAATGTKVQRQAETAGGAIDEAAPVTAEQIAASLHAVDPDDGEIEGDPSGVDRITAHPMSAEDEAREHAAQRERDAALFDEQEPDEADPVDADHPSNTRV